MLDQSKPFRSIKPIFQSIKSRIESFLKTLVFHVFKHFSKVSNTFSLSIRSVKTSNQVFFRFPSNLLQGFCHLRPVRPYCPSFFIYFQFSCIFVMHFGIFLNLREFGTFEVLSLFFQNWLMVFVVGCYKRDPCGLIWSICWIRKIWNF